MCESIRRHVDSAVRLVQFCHMPSTETLGHHFCPPPHVSGQVNRHCTWALDRVVSLCNIRCRLQLTYMTYTYIWPAKLLSMTLDRRTCIMLELVLPNYNGAIGPAKVYRKEVCLMFCKTGVVMHGKNWFVFCSRSCLCITSSCWEMLMPSRNTSP